MNKRWRWALLPLYPLLLANALVAYLYAVIWCRAHSWELRSSVLTFVAAPRGEDLGYRGGSDGSRMAFNPGGQGWSWIVGYASQWHRDQAELRGHENTHVFQELMFALLGAVVAGVLVALGHPGWATLAAFAGGPLFMVCYLAGFVVGFFRARSFWGAYRANPFEQHAYDVEQDFADGDRPDLWI